MQLQAEIDDLGLCLSFNCYFPDSVTAMAAAKVSREFNQEQTARFHEFTDVDELDFEFSSEAQVSHTQIDLDIAIEHQQFDFPVSDSELLTKEINYASSNSDSIQLHKFYANQQYYESPSSSSSESDEFGVKRSGFFCMWSPKSDVSKSGSTGSRRWRIQNFLRRSSSEGEQSTFFLRSKKTDATKQNRNVNSGDVTKVAGESSVASSPSFQEQFYVQKRAQQKRDKLKSFLPYRQDLVGLFVNINRIRNKKSPF